MKKRILLIALTICASVFTYAQEQLQIDISKSELKWSCDYAFYFGGHYGLVTLKDGYFIKTNDKITGGSFTINLNSITSTDIENPEANAGLVEHLKNEDFFDVNTYPTAKLVITETRYHDATHLEVIADLTIKDVTLPIRFQAEVNFDALFMTTKFKIDRTLWHINYKSKNAMSDLKNQAISDAIGFEIKLML